MFRGSFKGVMLGASALCSVSLGYGIGHAQTTPPASSPAAGETAEVVVTASKREQRIIDVPYAVTAVGREEIDQRGSYDIKDLQYSIPGLNITPGTLGQDRIALRGVNAGFGTGLPVVGVYVDDVGVSVDQQQRDTDFPLVDVDRIEVLRGPQGTLYGQGSESGTIRYITHNPSLTHYDGFVEANGYGQTEGGAGGRIQGAFGGPLVEDKLGLRVVAGYNRQAGWIDYPAISNLDANSTISSFIRSKILWKPDERLSVNLLYQYSNEHANASPFAYQGSTSNNATRLDGSRDRTNLVDLTASYDLGFATLTSATGYLHRDYNDAFPAPFPFLLSQDTRYEQKSEEVRLVSKSGGPFTWTVGAIYRDFAAPTLRTVNTASLPPALRPVYAAALDRSGTDPVNSQSYAVFGDGTYALTSKLNVSVGLRYYSDDRQFINITAPYPALTTVYVKDKASFDSVSPRFNVQYNWTPDISTYLQAAKGFRSGGFNTTPQVPTYGAESLWSYEGGAKMSLLNGRLFLDAAVYYLDYSNRQSQALVNVGGLQIASTTNGGSASGPGVEFSATSKLPYGLNFDMSVSYNDVTFDNTTIENYAGERFGLVSPWTGGASLYQRFLFPNSDVIGFWRADYQHADASEELVRGLGPGGAVVAAYDGKSATHDTLNLHAGVIINQITVTLEALNVTDNRAVVYPFLGYGPGYNQTLRPTSIGLTVRYDFK